jgi:phage/plasmid-associated DNA primase
MHKLLVAIEEATYMHNKQDQQLLKHLITSPTINIERKGHDIQSAKPNYLRFIFTSNSLSSIYVEPSDRRFQILDVSTEKANNIKYFGDLYNRWYDGHEREAFFHMMKNYDIKGFDFTAQRVSNEITFQQKLSSATHIHAWFYEWIADDEAADEPFIIDQTDQGFTIARSAVYQIYLQYCSLHRVRYIHGKIKFKRFFSDLFSRNPELWQEKRTTKDYKHMYVWLFADKPKLAEFYEKKYLKK